MRANSPNNPLKSGTSTGMTGRVCGTCTSLLLGTPQESSGKTQRYREGHKCLDLIQRAPPKHLGLPCAPVPWTNAAGCRVRFHYPPEVSSPRHTRAPPSFGRPGKSPKEHCTSLCRFLWVWSTQQLRRKCKLRPTPPVLFQVPPWIRLTAQSSSI